LYSLRNLRLSHLSRMKCPNQSCKLFATTTTKPNRIGPKKLIEKASEKASDIVEVVGRAVLELAGFLLIGSSDGFLLIGSSVGFHEGIPDGTIDPLGAPVGEVGVDEGGVVDGMPDGGTVGMSVVSERHLTSVSYC
jgi:hypothetical protein